MNTNSALELVLKDRLVNLDSMLIQTKEATIMELMLISRKIEEKLVPTG